jgi:phosphopantetheine adenylyltransferase
MISSSIVRQIFINNGDINSLIPNAVNIPIND